MDYIVVYRLDHLNVWYIVNLYFLIIGNWTKMELQKYHQWLYIASRDWNYCKFTLNSDSLYEDDALVLLWYL